MTILEKFDRLKGIIRDMGEVVVAYSGGVDSTFLLKVAIDELGSKAYGVLAHSPTYPTREVKEAQEVANSIGAHIELIETHELDNPIYAQNPVDRCYHCKKELFREISYLAEKKNFKNLVDGSNFDDIKDYRPGMKALREIGVRSPLQEAFMTKQDIRDLSHQLGLSTWNKDSFACLASRFAYGDSIDIAKLTMIDKVENFLYELGFRNVRARHADKTVRIEVSPSDLKRFLDDQLRLKIVEQIKSIGYIYITLDLEGYRTGSMNASLINT